MTTTVLIEDALQARLEAAAAEAGKTVDAFIVEAIAESVEQAEEGAAFRRLANQRWAKILATGLTVSWDEMNEWVEARLRGETPPRPVGRPIGH
jgi:predicted transcriptional regulator